MGISTIAVHGDVDLTTAPGYIEQSRAILESGETQALVIDLGGAGFIDSQGIGFLVESRNIALKKNIDVRLRSVPPRVLKVLQITGLAPVFTIED